MLLARKVGNRVRGLLQAHGTTGIKRRLWDHEFSHGRWTCLEETPDDCVYSIIEKYANGGRILDLGCGSGSTGNELDASRYREYLGVDISDVAIAKARYRTNRNGRADKNDYVQSDIASYVPREDFDLILFRDSICYIPWSRIPAMLRRYSRSLNNGGVFIVRLSHGADKYKPIMDMIEQDFDVIEKQSYDEPNAVVTVFRPNRTDPEQRA